MCYLLLCDKIELLKFIITSSLCNNKVFLLCNSKKMPQSRSAKPAKNKSYAPQKSIWNN